MAFHKRAEHMFTKTTKNYIGLGKSNLVISSEKNSGFRDGASYKITF